MTHRIERAYRVLLFVAARKRQIARLGSTQPQTPGAAIPSPDGFFCDHFQMGQIGSRRQRACGTTVAEGASKSEKTSAGSCAELLLDILSIDGLTEHASYVNRRGTRSGHPVRPLAPLPSRAQVEAAAEMFRALADPERLRLLLRLAESEACVSELAQDEGEKITTVSARLKTLAVVRLVRRRREAKHVFYALADEHVLPLVRNAIDHAAESRTVVSADFGHGKDTTR